jgi:peptidyl-prolyl cis-trans isomerase SurA
MMSLRPPFDADRGRPAGLYRARSLAVGVALLAAVGIAQAQASASTAAARSTDRAAEYIVAVVNQELVAASEVRLRTERMREDLRRRNQPVPSEAALRQQAIEMLVD